MAASARANSSTPVLSETEIKARRICRWSVVISHYLSSTQFVPAGGQVSVVRRDRLWREDSKVAFVGMAREEFLASAAAEIEDIQRSLHAEATARRDANIHRGLETLDQVAAFYGEQARYPGWVELGWARPTGAELEDVVQKLKALKLTIRNTPMDGRPVTGTCPFTGRPAVEWIYVARSY